MERAAVYGGGIQASLGCLQCGVGHRRGPPGVRVRLRTRGCDPGEGVRVREPAVEPGQRLLRPAAAH